MKETEYLCTKHIRREIEAIETFKTAIVSCQCATVQHWDSNIVIIDAYLHESSTTFYYLKARIFSLFICLS